MRPYPDKILEARRSRGYVRWLAMLMILVVGGAALWTWLTMSWSYAEGERGGILQKFVRRGWLCKTREGEIALYYGGGTYLGQSLTPQIWDFSVRDPAVAEQLNKAVTHRVQLHYTEHPGIPTSCFGETRYFVDRVTVVDDSGAPIVTAPAPAPQPSTPGTSPPTALPQAAPAQSAPSHP